MNFEKEGSAYREKYYKRKNFGKQFMFEEKIKYVNFNIRVVSLLFSIYLTNKS